MKKLLILVITIQFFCSAAHANNYWLEAETTDSITTPMQVSSDGNASGCQFIWVPNGLGKAGEATYTVDITQAGEHILWGRVIAPSSEHDSFYVKFEGRICI